MKKIIVITIFALSALAAHAEQPYKQFYLANGQQVPSEQAILAALKGNEVFKCTSVTAKASKSGTSIGIKAIKKPKNNS